MGQAGDDIGIAGVIADTGQYGDASDTRPGLAQGAKGGLAGTFHKFGSGDAMLFNRHTVNRTNLLGTV